MNKKTASDRRSAATDCYLSLQVDGQKRVVRKIEKYTDREFVAQYKGREIHCWQDMDDPDTGQIRFYIIVTVNKDGPNDGMIDYDGWAPEIGIDTIEDAVAEAIRGACL